MNFDTTTIATGLPLGSAVSLLLSFLKAHFKLSSDQSKLVVALAGLLYFAGTTASESMTKGMPIYGSLTNGLISAFALVFGSEGFYQWIGSKFVESAK